MRVAAGATAVFIALFSGLYVQMASGDDPAPAKASTTAQVAPATTSADSSPMTTHAS